MSHPQFHPYEVTWEDLVLRGGIDRCFVEPDRPLEVEVGPGDDDHLLLAAHARPDHNWLGIEYSHKRVRRCVRRLERMRQPPENLRLIWRAAADIVAPFLSPGRVQAFHVLFPDPWPKAHHARFRMLTPAFLADLGTALVPGGHVAIATDDRDYAEEIVGAGAAVPTLHNAAPPPGWRDRPEAARRTVFEDRWRTQGRSVHAIEFTRVNRSVLHP